MSNVGAHCPTNVLACRLPLIWSFKDVAIDPTAAQRNQSEGTLAVCCSIILKMQPAILKKRSGRSRNKSGACSLTMPMNIQASLFFT